MTYQFTPVMSSVVETSLRFFRIRFSDFVDNLHSLRSVEMTIRVNIYIVPYNFHHSRHSPADL